MIVKQKTRVIHKPAERVGHEGVGNEVKMRGDGK